MKAAVLAKHWHGAASCAPGGSITGWISWTQVQPVLPRLGERLDGATSH